MSSRFRYSWLVLRLPIFLRNVFGLKVSVRLLGIVGSGCPWTTYSNREGRSRRIPSLVMVSHLLPDSSSAAAWLLASFVPRGLSRLRLASRGAPVAPLTVVEVVLPVAGWLGLGVGCPAVQVPDDFRVRSHARLLVAPVAPWAVAEVVESVAGWPGPHAGPVVGCSAVAPVAPLAVVEVVESVAGWPGPHAGPVVGCSAVAPVAPVAVVEVVQPVAGWPGPHAGPVVGCSAVPPLGDFRVRAQAELADWRQESPAAHSPDDQRSSCCPTEGDCLIAPKAAGRRALVENYWLAYWPSCSAYWPVESQAAHSPDGQRSSCPACWPAESQVAHSPDGQSWQPAEAPAS